VKQFFIRFLSISFGVFLFSLGIVLTLKANIGYAPWEVFHVGLSITTGLSIGIVSIIVGLLLLVVVTLLGEKFGFGALFNIIMIGLLIDLKLYLDIIPEMETLLSGCIMLIIGLFIISLGSFFYIQSAFGAGPRDNLMVVLVRKTKIPVGLCRSFVELTATVIGWFLGGMVGVGTILSVIGIGFCIQITFKLFKFDVTKVKHESMRDTINNLRGKG